MILDGKSVLITGGTGSLGRALVRLILDGRFGNPERDGQTEAGALADILGREEGFEDAPGEVGRAAAVRENIRPGDGHLARSKLGTAPHRGLHLEAAAQPDLTLGADLAADARQRELRIQRQLAAIHRGCGQA